MDLYDLHQNQRINQFSQEARNTARTLEESTESVQALKLSVQRLALVCNAMWQLIQDNTELTEADLIETVEYLEHQLGKAIACPQCGRAQANANKRSSKCLYCGTDLPANDQDPLGRLFNI